MPHDFDPRGVQLITKDDLRDLRDVVVEEMRDGFSGVHTRQDVTNGRLNAAELELARQQVRLATLDKEVLEQQVRIEKEISERPRYQKTTTVTVDENERPALTARELKLIIAVGGGVIGLLELLRAWGPALKALMGVQP